MYKDIICMFIIILLFLPIMIFTSNQLTKNECSAKAKALGYKYEYSFITGCVLEKPNGKKILLEQLRDFDEK